MQFDIAREEVLELAARKIADDFSRGDGDLADIAANIVSKKTEAWLAEKLDSVLESALDRELEKLLDTGVRSVNEWGEPVGESKTLRERLRIKAGKFWDEKVDANGRTTTNTYHAKTRAEFMFGRVVLAEYEKAVAGSMTEIKNALKKSLTESAAELAKNYVDSVFRG